MGHRKYCGMRCYVLLAGLCCCCCVVVLEYARSTDSPAASAPPAAASAPPAAASAPPANATVSHAQRCPLTWVTAYFQIPSKHSAAEYRAWLDNLLSMGMCLVAYTDTEDLFPAVSGRRLVIATSLEEEARAKLPGDAAFWRRQHSELDPDRGIHHGERVYWVWNLKAVFLDETARADPFRSDAYVWIDAGYLRDGHYRDRDVVALVPPAVMTHAHPDSIFILYMFPFTERELREPQHPMVADHLAAGMFGGTAAAVALWRAALRATMDSYIGRGLFVGKEQTLMNAVCAERPSLCMLVPTLNTRPGFDVWFSMVPWILGEYNAPPVAASAPPAAASAPPAPAGCLNLSSCFIIEHIHFGRTGNMLLQLGAVEHVLARCSGLAIAAPAAAGADGVLRLPALQVYVREGCSPMGVLDLEAVMQLAGAHCARRGFEYDETWLFASLRGGAPCYAAEPQYRAAAQPFGWLAADLGAWARPVAAPVMHFRGGDLFDGTVRPDYGQPVCDHYLRALAHAAAGGCPLLLTDDPGHPCVRVVQAAVPCADLARGCDAACALTLFARSRVLVVGVSTLTSEGVVRRFPLPGRVVYRPFCKHCPRATPNADGGGTTTTYCTAGALDDDDLEHAFAARPDQIRALETAQTAVVTCAAVETPVAPRRAL